MKLVFSRPVCVCMSAGWDTNRVIWLLKRLSVLLDPDTRSDV